MNIPSTSKRIHSRWLWLLALLLLAACRSDAATPPAPMVTEPPDAAAFTLRDTLLTADIPPRDPRDLALRLANVAPDATRLPAARDFNVGDSDAFWYKNRNNGENERVAAELIYRSDRLNMWLEASESIRDANVQNAAEIIETEILPSLDEAFGNLTQQGADGDSRINLLYLADIGPGVGGYFSAADQFSTAVNEFSNQRDLLYINLDAINFTSDAHYSVVAHELQHLYHFRTDINEALWVDEGLSELAAALAGYPTPRREEAYGEQPDIQLTTLRQDPDVVAAHYSAAYLFFGYFHEQYGAVATQALLQQASNGQAGIEAVLGELGFPITFDELFADWLIANYLEGANVLEPGQGGPYAYRSFDADLPSFEHAAEHRRYPVEATASVAQYGVDYIQLNSSEPVTVEFTGSQQVSLLPTEARSGSYLWSTMPADRSDMTLTGRFDLTQATTPTLSFATWFDIEAGWDYAYIAVSTDDGATWSLLNVDGMTSDDPQGNSYGPAFTGHSGGGDESAWVEVTHDLAQFAGEEILLRFEYVTDDAVHNAGWALDDIRISDIEFADDAESDSGVWEMAGFVRHANRLPQQFIVQAVLLSRSTLGEDFFLVETVTLDDGVTGRFTLDLNDTYDEAILIVTATTPTTTLPATYQYRVER